jgi:hypothetical protein
MRNASKSMFSNASLITTSRSLYNPVSLGGGGSGSGGGSVSSDLSIITSTYLNTLTKIHQFYGLNMVNKTYYNIPNDFEQYIQLYVVLQQIQKKVQNSALSMLLKLAEDTLVGAINSYEVYGDKLVLQLNVSNLQQQIQTILSNKNQKFVEVATSTGQLSVNKTFKLAPVFNLYILIYGMPEFGVGFDQIKISYLIDILKQNGIDPYK